MWAFIRSILGLPPRDQASSKARPAAPDPQWLRSAARLEDRNAILDTLSDLRMRQLIHAGDHYRLKFETFRADWRPLGEEIPRETAERTFADHPALAPAYLLHSNGYIREAAINALSPTHMSAFALIVLSLRCNDWVGPVRTAALSRLIALLPQVEPHMREQVLPVLIRRAPSWRRYRRVGHLVVGEAETDFLERILTLPCMREAAISVLASARSGPTTRLLRALARYDWIDPHLEELARNAHATGIRRAAMSALLSGEIYWPTGRRLRLPADSRERPEVARRTLTVRPDPTETLHKAASDRAAPIRALAADALIRTGPDSAPADLWQPLMSDRHPAVRKRMDFFRRKWLDDDLPDYLRR